MKAILLSILPILLFTASCKKDTDTSEPAKNNTNYINTMPGSSWQYHEINASGSIKLESDYIVTSTNKDTLISNKSYHIYMVSRGGHRYLHLNGKEYYEFDTIPGGGSETFERFYLKTGAVPGTNWTQSQNIAADGLQIPAKINNIIVDNALTRVVNGKTYENVIHVSTTITSTLIPAASLTTDIHSYYAPDYGLIENTSKINLNYLGVVKKLDLSTKLTTAALK